ncbi:MAG: SUF system Fe-S cluster assembly protein [Azospirillum sp.]|nr:SUF system Fe-S cluster assembly protein [Azospirillum sp.]
MLASSDSEAVSAEVEPALVERVIEALKSVYDPEIPVNIYELGLVYRVDANSDGDVEIDMTLTAPSCPVAGEMPGMVEDAVSAVAGVRDCRVELVWEPTWTPARMSEVAKIQLDMF